MRKSLLSFIFILGIFPVSAQLPSNCDVKPVLRNYYEPDVKDMALKWLYSIKSADTALIDIPQWCQDTIWRGLAAIFNRHDLPEVDSVFNKYCVHTEIDCWYASMIFRNIIVDIDTLYSWTHNWINYQTKTGVPYLDSVLARYGFTVVHVYQWPHDPPSVRLFTTQLINTFSLCDSLKSFPGILSAEPDGLSSTGAESSLEFSDTSDIKYYRFSMGFGNDHYNWMFKVNPDCSIGFLGSGSVWGYDSLPAPVNCNILYISQADIPDPELKVYPNPSFTHVTIETHTFQNQGHLSIFNINGREIITCQVIKSKTQIDISQLTGGIYFVKLTNDRNVEVGKIIKE